MASLHPFHPFLWKHHTKIQIPILSTPGPIHRRSLPQPRRRFYCSSATSTSRDMDMKSEAAGKNGDKVNLRIRLNHQVQFGEQMAIIGSAEGLGSWKDGVPMEWTPDGWVCEIELSGGEAAEYKFVILREGEKEVTWEDGENRVLNAPSEGNLEIVCHWNKTSEGDHLLGAEGEEGETKGAVGDGEVVLEAGPSQFVDKWQGREVSFTRSNDHGSRESVRRLETEGLDGVALKLVEGDLNTTNSWRKAESSPIIEEEVPITNKVNDEVVAVEEEKPTKEVYVKGVMEEVVLEVIEKVEIPKVIQEEVPAEKRVEVEVVVEKELPTKELVADEAKDEEKTEEELDTNYLSVEKVVIK